MAVTNLKNGSTGKDVEKLQKALEAAGYDVGKTGADGVYGKNTAAAVKQYQKDNGLAVDGIAGKNTQGLLYGTNLMAQGGLMGAQILAPNAVNTNNKPGITPVEVGEVEPSNPTKDKDKVEDKKPADDKGTGTQESFTYDEFSYNPYAPSDIVNQANAALQEWMNQKPGAYESQWQAMIDEYMNKIMNREEFSYNFNEDALYQQYKDIYTQQGLMAMMDTMGQASAMTGGYGNSYAQTVGQQAYNQQLSQLNNVLPELYQMAFDRYAYEGEQMMNEYGMLLDRENTDYNRYQNNLDNWYTQLQYLTDRYDTERGFDLDQYAQGRAEAWDEHVAGREEAWDEYLMGMENEETAAGLLAGVGEYDRLKDMYGLTDDEVAKLEAAYTEKEETGKTEDKKANYDNGTLQSVHVKKLQQILGVTADGKWGKESKAAAGGLTADEAWEAYRNGTLVKKETGDNTVNSYGLTQSRSDEIYAWLEKALTNPNIGASFDPIKLINGSSYLTSDAERNFAKELLQVLK